MAMLAAIPTPHMGFQKEYPWDPARSPSYPPQRQPAIVASHHHHHHHHHHHAYAAAAASSSSSSSSSSTAAAAAAASSSTSTSTSAAGIRVAPPTPMEVKVTDVAQITHQHAYDRTPFSGSYAVAATAAAPPPGYAAVGGYGGYATADLGGYPGTAREGKQRKRRGNLPKETTDKLRAWFMTHLSHPYPTEDEKQELMRVTKLQMNQISNWFINARRRQLPTMISNARIEDGPALSDGEGVSSYEDEEMESLRRRRGPAMDRGSV
ncbi:hypothetical protein GMORB2_6763 [Geosmithia morbida]|uniref:Homeobox domain-containing protein n=1 Tax=Geosmithia morbida TaxID=1094350 RepID=A0A9P5D0X4_9HYPO|nr:uncharacterized protein GMORB2_6763 [Geosmithia morbida]KAF4123213.1 hypothetical protein GMORB2_6763 [Geosmithia morbida]